MFPQLGNIKVENINCSPFECLLIDFYGRSSDRNNSIVTTWTTMIRRAGFLFLFLSRLIHRSVECLHCAAYTRCVLTSGSELILSAKYICTSREKRTLENSSNIVLNNFHSVETTTLTLRIYHVRCNSGDPPMEIGALFKENPIDSVESRK